MKFGHTFKKFIIASILSLLASTLVATPAQAASGVQYSTDAQGVYHCNVATGFPFSGYGWDDLLQDARETVTGSGANRGCTGANDRIAIIFYSDLAVSSTSSTNINDRVGLDFSGTQALVELQGSYGASETIDLSNPPAAWNGASRFVTKTNLVGDISIRSLNIINGRAGAVDMANGGAVYDLSLDPLDLHDVVFKNNSALNDGGALYVNSVSGADNIFGGTDVADGNEASHHGGAIYTQSGAYAGRTVFQNNSAALDGGAIYEAGTDALWPVTISESRLESNSAGRNGGAIFSDAPTGQMFQSISYSSLAFNEAGGKGGAIYFQNGSGPTIDHSAFELNLAGTGGGGAYIATTAEGVVDIQTSEFSSNVTAAGKGGGLELDSPNASLFNTTVWGNSAVTNGGGISSTGTITLNYVTVANSTANAAESVSATSLNGIGSLILSNNSDDTGTCSASIAIENYWTLTNDNSCITSEDVPYSDAVHPWATIGVDTTVANNNSMAYYNMGIDQSFSPRSLAITSGTGFAAKFVPGDEFTGTLDAFGNTMDCGVETTFSGETVCMDQRQQFRPTYADGLSKISAGAYQYSPLSITKISNDDPSDYRYQMPVSPTGGVAVIITGTGFNENTTFTFDGATCTPTRVTYDEFDCSVPGHSEGLVDVVADNLAYSDTVTKALGFSYSEAVQPTIDSLSGTADGGYTVSFTGTDFQIGATVKVNGFDCPIDISGTNNTGTFSCTLPSSLVSGDVTVEFTNADLQTATNTFTYSPVITSVTPSSGGLAGGDSITIAGWGLTNMTGATLGGNTCSSFTVNEAGTEITCTTPSGSAGYADVAVSDGGSNSTTSTNAYSYTGGGGSGGSVTITLVTPSSGPTLGGDLIRIEGSGFLSGANVTIGGAACIGVTVVSATVITCTTGFHVAGLVSVIVTNTDASSASAVGAYRYADPTVIDPLPSITWVDPSSGSIAGGTVITIHGQNFDYGAQVTIDGLPCLGAVVLSDTTITCTTPAHAVGLVAVEVTNPNGEVGSRANAFTFVSDIIAPSAPGKPKVTVANNSIWLSWTAPTVGTGPFTYNVTSDPAGPVCTVSGLGANCTGLTNGVPYSFKVTAKNSTGEASSEFSEVVSISTDGVPKPVAIVSSLSLTGFAGNSAKLTSSLKKRILAYVRANAGVLVFTCQGYTAGKPVLKTDKALAAARARAVCAYLRKLNPNAILKVEAKTPGLPFGARYRKVIIRGLKVN